ncbi:MAG: two-component system sensor kinase FixL, partial [Gammaproteobacteria bacterium]
MKLNNNLQISLSPQFAILWYSIIAGLLSVGLMAFVVLNIEVQERAHIDRVTQTSANGIKMLLEEDIQEQVISLTKLADLYKTPLLTRPSETSSENWDMISKDFYETKHGYQALVWVDKSFNLVKIIPIKGKQTTVSFDSAIKDPEHLAELRAMQITMPTTAILLQSSLKNQGLGIYVPVISITQSGKELDSFIGGVVLFEAYIKKVIPSYLLTEHQFTLFIDEQEIYSDPPKNAVMPSAWIRRASFTVGTQTWQIDLAPKSKFLSRTHFHMMKILIVLGILLSFFIAVAVYTGLFAANKAHIIIDDRKKTKQLLHNLPGMAYQALNKKNWPMILVSEGSQTLTGYTKLEFEQYKVLWGSLIHPDDYERVRKTISNASKKGHVFELEYRIKTLSNEIKLVLDRGETVRSTYNNEVVIEGFISDITSIKQVESDLIDSDAFSETIVNSVVEAVITIDEKGFVKSFNNAANKMFGYSSAEIKDQALTTLMPKTYADKHDKYLTQYLSTNQAHIIGKGRELVAKRKDGTTFPIHLSVSEFQNNEKRMFVGLIRDITQQRASQNQIGLHTEQLAHADRLNALGEMAAGIAHEINQPLTAISLYSQTAKNYCDSEQFEKLPAIFEKMSEHARRAGAVIESV